MKQVQSLRGFSLLTLLFTFITLCGSISAAAPSPRVVIQHAKPRMKHREGDSGPEMREREGRGEHSDYLRATDEGSERRRLDGQDALCVAALETGVRAIERGERNR